MNVENLNVSEFCPTCKKPKSCSFAFGDVKGNVTVVLPEMCTCNLPATAPLTPNHSFGSYVISSGSVPNCKPVQSFPRRAGTPEQKHDIIERLYSLWSKHPDLRLPQLILNCFNDDFYHTEDVDFIETLEQLYGVQKVSINERDTQFAGFAKELWKELETAIRQKPGFIPEGASRREPFLTMVCVIIARRAHDLVEHTLHILDEDQYIPDLTELPEPNEDQER